MQNAQASCQQHKSASPLLVLEVSTTKKIGKDEKKKQPEILPKEEIEKRLKRAERFGQNTEQTNELKAMLRHYRFAGN